MGREPQTMNLRDMDPHFMKLALRLALKGRGLTSPNPMVGAVVVADGAVVGKGCHEFIGGPHAEVNALENAGARAAGATLYVTLEPCNHYGRTPPCTAAIFQAGISRVVVGMKDPNPRVEGSGTAFLREHRITVDEGILEKECRLLNQAFIKYVTTGIPYVVLKAALTLDGRIATRTGDSRWISNEHSRRYAHNLRCDLDAVLVGLGTALADDPQLTARVRRTPSCRQPIRVVLDMHLRLCVTAQLVRTAPTFPLWVVCGTTASRQKEEALQAAGAEVVRVGFTRDKIDLPELLKALGAREVSSLLVEGGGQVLGSFLEEGLADSFHFFYAPKILGDPQGIPVIAGKSKERMSEALPVYDARVRRFGEDIMLSGRFHRNLY
jgi:diaminohydroxyphosphoribosylaminopyrimidine deaminase/5-amino-6-(5-phosphoribosylamino)uracil reductase